MGSDLIGLNIGILSQSRSADDVINKRKSLSYIQVFSQLGFMSF